MQGARTDPRGAPIGTGQRAGGSVTVTHAKARKGKASNKPDAQSQVERTVVNCLRCGKIFHTDLDTSESKFLVGTNTDLVCCPCAELVALSKQHAIGGLHAM